MSQLIEKRYGFVFVFPLISKQLQGCEVPSRADNETQVLDSRQIEEQAPRLLRQYGLSFSA